MRIGISAGAYLDRYGLEAGAEKLREHGYDCVDFGGFTNTETAFFKLPESEFEADIVRRRRAIEAAGIKVNQTHSPWRCPARDSTPEERAERFDAMAKAIRGSAYIGADDFVIHAIMPFGTNSPDHPELMRDMNADFMGRLALIAKEYGVKHINVENLPFPSLPINHTCDVIDFVKRMNREVSGDVFRVCLDTGHSNVCGETPADAVRRIGRELLGTLHVHDNDGIRDFHWLPGLGNVDWAAFTEALLEIGFDGVFNFETSVSGDVPNGEERDRMERELAEMGHRIAGNAR